MKNISLLIFFVLIVGCSSSPEQKDDTQYPEELSSIFESHGGYDIWSKMVRLSFDKDEERHLINLQNRQVRIEGPDKTIGFNGKDVWVYPDTVSTERARFYHNLYFYFFAMPFVLGDPGINYEILDNETILNGEYGVIRVSYNLGVGDSPKDNYILYYNLDTYQMEWLKYTVTFNSQEENDNYRLIKYESWGVYNTLRLPVKMVWYEYDGEKVGEPRSEAIFENVIITTKIPNSLKFMIPEGSAIAD